MSTFRGLVDRYLANGLADFQGLHVTGSIPVHEDIINDLLSGVVQGGLGSGEPRPDDGGSALSGRVQAYDLLKLVKKLEVRASEGRITLDFELRV